MHRVAILAGGISTERQISLQSGRCVAEALGQADFDVLLTDISPSDLSVLDDDSIGVFFVALHGSFGEDGQLQQVLEDKGLCYTGSGPRACGLAMNKWASKQIFQSVGLEVPKAIRFDGTCDLERLERDLYQLGERFVVKPVGQGSSIGVDIFDNPADTIEAAQRCFAGFGDCIIEQFIGGRELTVGVVLDEVLPVLEIRPKSGFYDFHAKYLDDNTEYLFDTIDDSKLIEKIEHDAVLCFKALGCRHLARVDFILDAKSRLYVLEVNTIPGMTTHSCVPKAAARIGLTMPDLCSKIVHAAIAEHQEKNRSKYHISAVKSGKKEEKTKVISQDAT